LAIKDTVAASTGREAGGPTATEESFEVLKLHVADLRQLLNSMDPAPFRERDLDPEAADYIVDWAREVRVRRPLALRVHVDGGPASTDHVAILQEAVKEYFRQRALSTRRQLSQLFRLGRISLVIGLAFFGAVLAFGEAMAPLIARDRYARLLQESLVIGGWVALWRPMEIFLYDWWPIRSKARLYERLSRIDVRLAEQPGEGRRAP
jgi:hypothetical protein